VYLKKLRLQNIKCFEDVTLEFPHTDGDYSGWNVILGENATGKSTLVQGIADLVMALHMPGTGWMGISDETWVSNTSRFGKLHAWFTATSFDDPK